MNLFKHRHFQYDIIIWAVRWYCKYSISYRELEEMLSERAVEVDHTTIYGCVAKFQIKLKTLKYRRDYVTSSRN
jgi:IS6 family transposase